MEHKSDLLFMGLQKQQEYSEWRRKEISAWVEIEATTGTGRVNLLSREAPPYRRLRLLLDLLPQHYTQERVCCRRRKSRLCSTRHYWPINYKGEFRGGGGDFGCGWDQNRANTDSTVYIYAKRTKNGRSSMRGRVIDWATVRTYWTV